MHHQGHHLARSQPRCTAPFTLPAGELLAMPGGDKPLAKIVNITKQGYDILGVHWGGLLGVVGIPEHSIFLAQETPLLIQNSRYLSLVLPHPRPEELEAQHPRLLRYRPDQGDSDRDDRSKRQYRT
jgi:hypothetical protein